MTRAPAAVRFEARTSNALWQFDNSPSDLEEIERSAWIDPERKCRPVPMLFTVVDYRSDAAYQEYRRVYGEDVESGLRSRSHLRADPRRTGLERRERNSASRRGRWACHAWTAERTRSGASSTSAWASLPLWRVRVKRSRLTSRRGRNESNRSPCGE